MSSAIEDGASFDPQDYKVDANGVLSLKGAATSDLYQLGPMAAEKIGTQLMVLKLAKPLTELFGAKFKREPKA